MMKKQNKIEKELEVVVVPKGWFESLLKKADEYKAESGVLTRDFKLASLLGYIESARFIIDK